MTSTDFPGRSTPLVDHGPYAMSNISGALVPESVAIFDALAVGTSIAGVRDQALNGTIFRQRSYQARRRFWHALHARYLAHGVEWVIADLCAAASQGEHDPTFLGLLYLHFSLRDRLTRDWILGPVLERWESGQHRMIREDVLADLETVLGDTDVRWTEASRKKHATSLLSALRDYGLARGVQVKHLQRPLMTSGIAAHLLRILVESGVRGAEAVEHPFWRLYFLNPDDVARELAVLAQSGLIRFERAGSTVVLETPWSEP
jgi:hypothetical protein